jgi:cytohesin
MKDNNVAKIAGLELLLRPGSDWLTMRTKDGMNALHLAVQFGNSSIIKQLVEIGVDVDSRSIEAKTPIHAAVDKRDITSLVTLLSASKQIDLQDNRGKTALHHAVGWPEGVNCLLERNADTDVQDQGITKNTVFKTLTDKWI